MASKYMELRQEFHDLKAEGLALVESAETWPLLEESDEAKRHSEITARLAALGPQLEEMDRLREMERQAPAVQEIYRGSEADDEDDEPDLPAPFGSLGEQLQSVRSSTLQGARVDSRLLEIQAATGASEGVQSDGGFLVQHDFSSELLRLVHETGVLAGRTDRTPISGNANGLKINAVDETSRADGSRQGGIQAYWVAEAGAPTKTKPKFRRMELELQKLAGLFYSTDELLMDAAALQSEVAGWFREEFGFKLDDAIIRGTGAGQPLGILGHAGTVSVGKKGGQEAATILKENIEQMYARMWPRSIPRAEWFINQDCWPALFQLSQVVGVGGVPVFLPPGGLSAAPFGMILGRPVTPIEQCETLGTVGDIIFADFSQYKMIEKGGIAAASSIHVKFEEDETAFRFILRTDGQPKRNAPLTPYKGTKTQSSFITLATRA